MKKEFEEHVNTFLQRKGDFILISFSSTSSMDPCIAKMWANSYQKKILNGPTPFTRFSSNLVFARATKLKTDSTYLSSFITSSLKNHNDELFTVEIEKKTC